MEENWETLRKEKQEKRAKNRAYAQEHLRKEGIAFESHNNGAHLVILCAGLVINFWPGTGLWRTHEWEGRGIYNLVKYIKRKNKCAATKPKIKPTTQTSAILTGKSSSESL